MVDIAAPLKPHQVEVLRWVDPESVVIIVSDHGNGPMPSLLFRVSTWLEQQGLLARHHAATVGPRALQVLHHAYRAVRGSAAAAMRAPSSAMPSHSGW